MSTPPTSEAVQMSAVSDMTVRLILARAGVGAGRVVAQRSWLRVLTDIRTLPER
jgi:hypothetical protein